MKNYLSFIAFALFAVSASAEQDLGNYTLWAGTLKIADNQITKGEETLKIPYVTKSMDPSFRHGFILRSKDGSDFVARVHVRFPTVLKVGKPDGTTQELAEYDSSAQKSTHGVYLNAYTFDDGDPSGVYKVEVFVNDKSVATLDFDIQPK